MRVFVILLVLVGCIAFVPHSFGAQQNLFEGNSSFERLPDVIAPNTVYEFELKLQITDSPYWLHGISPVVNISPKTDANNVHISFEKIPSGFSAIHRVPVTLYVDQNISSEKIFLNISFVSENSSGDELRSSWMDSLILDIGTNQTSMDVQPKQTTKHDVLKLKQNGILVPPLNQINLGIQPDQVKCKENLILIQKYDGMPACVTEQTKQKLVERGWTENESTTKTVPARTTPSESPFDEKDPQTKIEIAFDERLDDKLFPIKITEVTTNAKNLDEITVWNFEPIGHSGDDRRIMWDAIPKKDRITYQITDEEFHDIRDHDRKDFIVIPLDLHAYRMNCGIFQTVSGESAHPTTFPIKKGTQTVFAQNSRIGIYPDSEGKYSLKFASIFPHDIRLPEDATETITYDTKECRLLQDIEDVEGEFNKGYYTKITFRYLEK